LIKSLSTKENNATVVGVDLLGCDEKINWSQKADGLHITPSANYPSGYAAAYRILFKK
ncbi:MAG: hypothetical protein JST13_13995, partial [Bacteroidetes bacterium]|nr:hypothetical protein [Bacteroidota bacterium]